MNFIILTDASSQIGMGHFTRCSAFASELIKKNIKVKTYVFGDYKASNVINTDWKTDSRINFKNKNVIIDSYLFDLSFIEKVKAVAKKVFVIDDLNRLDYEGVVIINPNIYGNRIVYNSSCQIYGGPKFSILRDSFFPINDKIVNKIVNVVTITFGGSDPTSMTPSVIEKLVKYNCQLNVVIGPAFSKRNISTIRSLNFKNIKYYENLDAKGMSDLFSQSDVIVAAAGQTINELMITNSIGIIFQVSDNQKYNVEFIKENNCAIVLDSVDKIYLPSYEEREVISKNVSRMSKKMRSMSTIIDEILEGI